MLCEGCGKKPATVHIVEIINNKKQEIHLCEDCEKKKGINISTPFQLSGLVSGLTQDHPEMMEMQMPADACANCGITYKDFQASGKFGCAEDYNTFREAIIPLIGKIQGNTYHKGKTPRHMPSADERQKKDQITLQIDELQDTLERAVAREDYEKAAELRDRIQELKEQLAEGEA